MTKRIFRSICFTAMIVFAVSIVLIMWFLYGYFSDVHHNRLEAQTDIAAHAAAREGAAFFEGLNVRDYRITWIDKNGKVIYDSITDVETMEDHSDREEFTEARKFGYGESCRYSSTLTERLLYSAKKLPDGTVIRLSTSQYTVLSLILEMLPPLVLIIVFSAGLSLFIAYRLSKKIVEPLNSLDLESPGSNTSYHELSPLLERIGSQQAELKEKAAILQKKQNEFDIAAENMNEGLVLLNSSGVILSINKAASRLLSASSFCIGKDLLMLNNSPVIQQLLQKAGSGEHAEAVMRLDGTDYSLNASPVFSDGRTVGIALLIFDISEKEKAEQMRREFTANVSHEIKNPLHTISGFAEIMRGGLVKPEDIQNFSGRIYSEAQRMILLVDDIIRLSHLDEGAEDMARENVGLMKVVDTVTEQLSAAAAEAKVTVTAAGDDISVFAVPQLVTAVIYNLMDNAVKYNRENGSVSVEIRDCGDYAQITVSDTGIGIPAEHLDRVFERFYRVDKSRSKQVGGTGLGLSIVKHSAAALNAEIELESVVNGGTTVTVRLPKNYKKTG
ncbi:MAG: ATP-binding protein [Ruminiclostridium sp.]|nr:ATP-binding protein [Ruminiclostridium sp.]